MLNFAFRVLTLLMFSAMLVYPQKQDIIILGDSQFQNPDVFEKTIKQVDKLKPNFVVHVGDMIHGYTYNIDIARSQWKKFLKQIEPLKNKFYPTAGNHDFTTKEIEPAFYETWGPDKKYYSINKKDVHFIILNSSENQILDSIQPAQLEWLKADLEKNKKIKNIFVSLHSPIYLSKPAVWQPIHELLAKYNVKAVFTGHFHSYDFRIKDGISYFCLNSSGNMKYSNHLTGLSHNFVKIEINGKNVNYKVYADGKIFKPDAVLPGEAAIAGKTLLERNSIIINPFPENEVYDTTITVRIKNNFVSLKSYNLKWENIPDGSLIEPSEEEIILEQGQEVYKSFKLTFNSKGLNNSNLPYLRLNYNYITQKNDTTHIATDYKLRIVPTAYTEQIFARFKIDGQLNEAVWNSAIAIPSLYVDYQFTEAEENTSVRIFYDSKNIYFGIKGLESNTKGLTALANGSIPLVFGDDDFEIFLTTDSFQKNFFRFMINPAGTIFSSGPKGLFTVPFEAKSAINSDNWTAEFKIPFTSLGFNNPQEVKNLRLNIRRNNLQSKIIQSDWSKMETYPPYQPEYFGILCLK